MRKMIPFIGMAFCAAVGFVVWCCVYVGAKSDYHLCTGRKEEGTGARNGAPNGDFFEDDEDDFDISSLLDEELAPDYYPEGDDGETPEKERDAGTEGKRLEEVL